MSETRIVLPCNNFTVIWYCPPYAQSVFSGRGISICRCTIRSGSFRWESKIGQRSHLTTVEGRRYSKRRDKVARVSISSPRRYDEHERCSRIRRTQISVAAHGLHSSSSRNLRPPFGLLFNPRIRTTRPRSPSTAAKTQRSARSAAGRGRSVPARPQRHPLALHQIRRDDHGRARDAR